MCNPTATHYPFGLWKIRRNLRPHEAGELAAVPRSRLRLLYFDGVPRLLILDKYQDCHHYFILSHILFSGTL